ncbi:HAD family hydrolase [Blautia luti]|uniref:HAD-IA family hydrolase n=1 Tax=Blautia luti DSM 14534 = JCM 17040 TaxID=649762 RepID=A0A844GR46_9FIRM|nr:HAD family hydrolase [Blautia luti]MTD62414.1 HAD-IA family hydrolase [Blautia luti DSM 14534 = JCM 17040]BEI59829.1 HAD family hydrolase [Blautia luti]
MIKACIFDLDGTLADTLESMAYVANEIMQKYGLKTLPTDNFRYYSGEGADMLMQRALKDAGDKELIHYEEGRRLYREMFAADPMYKVVPYEGMPETLKELKKRGIRLAVCSNKPHPAAVKVIAQLYGDDFDMVLGQSDAIRRKPAPDGPLMIAGKFGVRPEECMYVGDTSTDMKTGKAAGMFTVGALWGFRDREELNANGADLVAEHPTDLVMISEEYCND